MALSSPFLRLSSRLVVIHIAIGCLPIDLGSHWTCQIAWEIDEELVGG